MRWSSILPPCGNYMKTCGHSIKLFDGTVRFQLCSTLPSHVLLLPVRQSTCSSSAPCWCTMETCTRDTSSPSAAAPPRTPHSGSGPRTTPYARPACRRPCPPMLTWSSMKGFNGQAELCGQRCSHLSFLWYAISDRKDGSFGLSSGTGQSLVIAIAVWLAILAHLCLLCRPVVEPVLGWTSILLICQVWCLNQRGLHDDDGDRKTSRPKGERLRPSDGPEHLTLTERTGAPRWWLCPFSLFFCCKLSSQPPSFIQFNILE